MARLGTLSAFAGLLLVILVPSMQPLVFGGCEPGTSHFRRDELRYRKNFYDSPSQEEVVESRLGRKSRVSETKFLEMD